MTIFRIERQDHDFTVIGNEALRDERLSWRATGLLAFLLSLPENWDPKGRDLTKRKHDGRDSTYAGLKELEEVGYVERVLERDARGRIRTVTVVREKPQVRPNPEMPDSVEQDSGRPGPLRRTEEEVPTEEEQKNLEPTLAPTSSSRASEPAILSTDDEGQPDIHDDIVVTVHKTRARDPVWDVLALVEGFDYSNPQGPRPNDAERGRLSRAVKLARQSVGDDAELLKKCIIAYPMVMPSETWCTAMAVATHLGALRMAVEQGIIAKGSDSKRKQQEMFDAAIEGMRRESDAGQTLVK